MKALWFKGKATPEAKEKRKKEIMAYTNAFDDLKEILEQMIEKEAVRDYGPGWEQKQIALNERNHAIREVLELINIKD